MYLKKFGQVELWGSCHPAHLGCRSEGREQCDCKYHIVNGDEILSFDSFQEAEEEFCELTGTERFVIGKSKWL